jgi:hypothetical protein
MIADTERLVDGFRGLPAGMDGSNEPPQTPSEAAWYATNVTFRGGNGPKTRPGFREIPTNYWRNPQPVRTATITITSGIATATVSGGHGYDNKDKVTIAGASPAGVNGTHTVTVTGSTTFTFSTTATGTVTGTITASRDVDAAYQDDFINGTTSRDRVIALRGAVLVQGSIVYQDPRAGNPSQLIVVADGVVYALNFENASCYRINEGNEITGTVPVYMVQAERYLIVQTGQDEPLIYDGYITRRASYFGDQVVPIGKQMAYGQGRLFVAVKDSSEITAGDLVLGGSTTKRVITTTTAANPTLVTTSTNHGFGAGDQITIEGHSSSPTVNSTYTILTAPGSTTFTIPVAVTSAGVGGVVSRANAGAEGDVLQFTETTFLNEGGNLTPAGQLGKITGLVFLPVQDTATGQGDLIAFCERGAVTFQVSVSRNKWKDTEGFQRILFDNIGSTSDSILPVNGDLFFRSREGNGIRTYRNARAESGTYGLTPISAEIDPVLKQDTQWMLDRVSFVNFDNRLLMTCLPKQYPSRASGAEPDATLLAQPIPTLYTGIAALDFQSVSSGRGKSAAVFDGVWTGLQIHKLVQGTFDGEPRCFAICLHEDNTGRRNEIWEITRNDEYDTPVEGPRVINAGIVTKAYDFRDDMSLKKLLRCDLWFDDIGGGADNTFTCSLAYRPDDYPNFTTWQTFQRNFVTEFLLEDKNLSTLTESVSSWTLSSILVNSDAAPNPLNGKIDADLIYEDTANAQHFVNRGGTVQSGLPYTLSAYVKAAGRNIVALGMSGPPWTSGISARFNLVTQSITNVTAGCTPAMRNLGDGWFRCSVTGVTSGSGSSNTVTQLINGTNATYAGDGASGIYLWGYQLEQNDIPTDYDPDPPQLSNYSRGYAPQVRFPTPPRTANLATDVPAYLGHDFTLRVNWAGHARLGRLMLHGQRVVEAVNGGTL